MTFKTRPGVVLTSICGEYYLVSPRSLQPLCPYLTNINETSAFLWSVLMEGATAAQLEEAVAKEYEVDDPDQVRNAIQGFLQQMLSLNYLLETQGEIP